MRCSQAAELADATVLSRRRLTNPVGITVAAARPEDREGLG